MAFNKRRQFPAQYARDPQVTTLYGRIGNLGSSFVVSGLVGVDVNHTTTHPTDSRAVAGGLYVLTLDESYAEFLSGKTEVLPAYSTSGLYGATIEASPNVQTEKTLYLQVWKDTFGYNVDIDNCEVAVELVLRKKSSNLTGTDS